MTASVSEKLITKTEKPQTAERSCTSDKVIQIQLATMVLLSHQDMNNGCKAVTHIK
jgi:hypothetical protein